MNWGSFLAAWVGLSIILLIIQRTESKHRRIVRATMVLTVFLVGWFGYQRGFLGETILAFFSALAVSFLFWLLIGRYNPVQSDDSIKVYGMDD
jgi:uncharacterized membrane protein YozB (DUF420 family)